MARNGEINVLVLGREQEQTWLDIRGLSRIMLYPWMISVGYFQGLLQPGKAAGNISPISY